MARHFLIAFSIYAALVFQPNLTTNPSELAFRLWLPGIVLVATVIIVEGVSSLIWAGLLGLGVDCFSMDRLGVHLFVATFVASCLVLVRVSLNSPGLVQIGGFAFAGTLLWHGLAGIIHGILDQRVIETGAIAQTSFEFAISTSGLVVGVLLAKCLFQVVLKRRRHPAVVLANHWTMLAGK